jgi:RND family efflux transporter MFP subunit
VLGIVGVDRKEVSFLQPPINIIKITIDLTEFHMSREFKRALLITSILGLAVLGSVAMYFAKPQPKVKDFVGGIPLVEAMTLEAFETSFQISSQGSVRPRTETILSAEVSGSIVSISLKFIAGGVFFKGEELMRIDPTNYAVAVDRTKASLTQRQIEFDGAEKLRSQGYRAESEYASAAAALAAANADVINAERNLERTIIMLPYDGMVRAKEADLGQYVNTGTRLGVTFATDYAEVRLPLTDQDLAFVLLPSAASIRKTGDVVGPSVELSAVQKGKMRVWHARIVRTEGVVDEKSRVTYAVASIKDPYRLGSAVQHQSELPVGTFVAAIIDGMTLPDVVRVPMIALRASNQLMMVDENNEIQMREVEVFRRDGKFAYLSGGAKVGDRIVLTTIESPLNGMKVRVEQDSEDRVAGAARQ